MPHQQYIADVALEIDEDTGLLAYSEVILVGPRQATGKTELILPAMTHRCLGFPQAGPQRVLYTTQTADKAREKWRDIHVARLDKSPLRNQYTKRLRLNSEAIMWRNGSVWFPGSTTGKTSGTGDSLDMGVIDEAWSRRDNRTELGMRPAMMTREWRQLWLLSMVPGLSRALPHEWPYLKNKMKAGRARVEAGINRGVAYFEFSAEPGSDPGHPDTWWSCMPGLGYTVQEKAIREDFEAPGMDLVDFCAEYLGWWPESSMPTWQVISEAVWEALADAGSGAVDPVALGVDSKPDHSVTSIGSAGLRLDGDVHAELLDRRPGMDWAVPRVVGICEKWLPCAIAIDPNGPAVELIVPLRQALANAGLVVPVLTPNRKEIAAGCGRLYTATGEVDAGALWTPERDEDDELGRRLRHLGQAELTTAVANVVRYYFGSQWIWARSDAGADVSPLYACTLAMWAGDEVEWAGGSYDIRESLGGAMPPPEEAEAAAPEPPGSKWRTGTGPDLPVPDLPRLRNLGLG